MGSANERWCHIVTPSLIGWALTQNDPCKQEDQCGASMNYWHCVGVAAGCILSPVLFSSVIIDSLICCQWFIRLYCNQLIWFSVYYCHHSLTMDVLSVSNDFGLLGETGLLHTRLATKQTGFRVDQIEAVPKCDAIGSLQKWHNSSCISFTLTLWYVTRTDFFSAYKFEQASQLSWIVCIDFVLSLL